MTATFQLATLQRRDGTTLREHADEVRCLVSTAYPEVDKDSQQRIELTKFHNTLADIPLQRYLLAAEPANLEEALDASRYYRQVEEAAEPEMARTVSGEINTMRTTADVMDRCLSMLQQITQRFAQKILSKKDSREQPQQRKSGNEGGRPSQPGRRTAGLTLLRPDLSGKKSGNPDGEQHD